MALKPPSLVIHPNSNKPMRIAIKIDPYYYPIIIVLAFVVGFVLAIALGFQPQHGDGGRHGQSATVPALTQTIPAWQMEALP